MRCRARQLAIALSLALAAPAALAAVYAHVDPVSGMTVLSNVPPAKAGVRVVTPLAPKAGVQPAAFPRVSGESQKQRDGLRREILAAELGGEQQALAAAAARGATADIVQRHIANVAALKRELAGVR